MFLPSSEALESRPCRRARGPGLGSTWLDLDLCEAGQRRAPSRVRAVALDVPCPALREAPHRPLLPALRSRAGSRGVARGSAGRGWALRAGSRRGPRAADVSKDECARTSPLFSGTDPLTARRAGACRRPRASAQAAPLLAGHRPPMQSPASLCAWHGLRAVRDRAFVAGGSKWPRLGVSPVGAAPATLSETRRLPAVLRLRAGARPWRSSSGLLHFLLY